MVSERGGGPFGELGRFARAALVDPVPRDHRESPAAIRRRQVVVLATLVVGFALLTWALRTPPGSSAFYVATLALAAVWVAGAVASGPLHLGRARTRTGRIDARPVVQPVVLGVALLLVFLAGALVVGRIPLLRGPVEELLDHARFGSLLAVALITAVNGVAEELFFRGALYAALTRHPVAVSTIAYTLSTVGTGVPLLVLAAAALGLVTGLQRRVTGGILAPMITHVVWSLGMLLLLPPALAIGD